MKEKKIDFNYTHTRVDEDEKGVYKLWYQGKDIIAMKKIKVKYPPNVKKRLEISC